MIPYENISMICLEIDTLLLPFLKTFKSEPVLIQSYWYFKDIIKENVLSIYQNLRLGV